MNLLAQSRRIPSKNKQHTYPPVPLFDVKAVRKNKHRNKELFTIKGESIGKQALKKGVRACGGYRVVVKKRHWQHVRKAMNLPYSTSSGSVLHAAWKRYFCSKGGSTLKRKGGSTIKRNKGGSTLKLKRKGGSIKRKRSTATWVGYNHRELELSNAQMTPPCDCRTGKRLKIQNGRIVRVTAEQRLDIKGENNALVQVPGGGSLPRNRDQFPHIGLATVFF